MKNKNEPYNYKAVRQKNGEYYIYINGRFRGALGNISAVAQEFERLRNRKGVAKSVMDIAMLAGGSPEEVSIF